MHFEQVTVF